MNRFLFVLALTSIVTNCGGKKSDASATQSEQANANTAVANASAGNSVAPTDEIKLPKSDLTVVITNSEGKKIEFKLEQGMDQKAIRDRLNQQFKLLQPFDPNADSSTCEKPYCLK